MNIKVKTAASFAVFGLLYTITAIIMPKAAIGNPMAPKIFPLALGIGITILSVLSTLKEYNIWKHEVAEGKEEKVTPEDKVINVKTNKLITLTAAAGIGYALLFEHFGKLNGRFCCTSRFLLQLVSSLLSLRWLLPSDLTMGIG